MEKLKQRIRDVDDSYIASGNVRIQPVHLFLESDHFTIMLCGVKKITEGNFHLEAPSVVL